MDSAMKAHWFFFDLDGTLADSLPSLRASIERALHSGGRRLRVDNLRPYIGPGIRVILKNLEGDLTEIELDEMEKVFRAHYDTDGVRKAEMFDGVRETLERLKANGAELFIVTNKPQFATANLAQQHGITGLFTGMLSRNSREPMYASKGEMLRDLVGRYRVDVKYALMVGDTTEDHRAAMEAGMRFAFAKYGYGELAGEVECIRIAKFIEITEFCEHRCGN